MNKLLIFPMAFMLILAIFAMLNVNQVYYGQIDEKGTPLYLGNKTYDDLTDFQKAIVDYQAEQAAMSGKITLQSLITIVAILTLALALAGVAGIHIFGSGLSTFSQKLIFNAALFGGIWACLSINSYLILFKDSIGIASMVWVILTFMYVLGMGIQIDASMAEGA